MCKETNQNIRAYFELDSWHVIQVLVSAQEGRVNNVSAAVGSSESTGMEDNSVDMVMSLQAFHWFEQDKVGMSLMKNCDNSVIFGQTESEI